MHSQMLRPHDHTGEAEDEHQHEKKSVLKKVKAKAKKIKDTLKLHGHGHNDHDHDQDQDHLLHDPPDDHDLDEEDEDEELVNDPEIHGVSGLHSAAVRNTVPDQLGNLSDTRNYYGSSEAAMGDQEPSYSQPTGLLRSFVPKQEDEGNRVDVERVSGIKEAPYTPVTSPASFTPGTVEQPKAVNPIESFAGEQEAIRGQPEISMDLNSGRFEEDPEAPNKNRLQHHMPTNCETKVTDPTREGTKEIEDSSILQKLSQMGISDESKAEAGELHSAPHDKSIFPTGSHDQFSPEPTPPISIMSEENPLSANDSKSELQPSEEGPVQSSYTQKISSATSAIADKAISAKNAVASKLGYGERGDEHEIHGEQEKAKGVSVSPVEYGKKIASTVTGKLTPVYDRVAETGSKLMSKAHGTYSRNEKGTQTEGQDRGVSVTQYLTEKLKPGEEDRALSEVISEALHKQKDERGETEKKLGKVTESEEVKRRLGSSGEENPEERLEATAGSGVVSTLKGVIGSLLGKGEETGSETREKRLQESEN